MANYCVTFRIADKIVGGKTYADRYNQLMANVRGDGQNGYWAETTAFFLVQSRLSSHGFAMEAAQGLSPADDLVVVFDPVDLSACYFGRLQHRDVLKSFFPSLDRVG